MPSRGWRRATCLIAVSGLGCPAEDDTGGCTGGTEKDGRKQERAQATLARATLPSPNRPVPSGAARKPSRSERGCAPLVAEQVARKVSIGTGAGCETYGHWTVPRNIAALPLAACGCIAGRTRGQCAMLR